MSEPVATRYAQAIFESAQADQRIDETLQELSVIRQLIHDHADLRQFLTNPDVDPEEKVGLFERVLKGGWSTLVKAFIQLVTAYGRAECLPEIIDAYAAMVDTAQGRMRVTVRSARELPDATLHRLRTHLERREGKRIELAAAVDPGLLGGLQVLLDHRVIDGSVRRELHDLRERLTTVRVS